MSSSVNSYSSPNIIRVMYSRRVRWAKQVDREMHAVFWWGNVNK